MSTISTELRRVGIVLLSSRQSATAREELFDKSACYMCVSVCVSECVCVRV